MVSGPATSPLISIRPGGPARVISVAVPAVAVGLVLARAVGTGLASGPDDPASPWIVAVVTVAVGCWLGWRAPTQRAELRPTELRCRNLATSFTIGWSQVESVVVLRRGPITTVDVRVRGLRRRLRVGAATRFTGHAADAVLDMIRAHPVAGAVLAEER